MRRRGHWSRLCLITIAIVAPVGLTAHGVMEVVGGPGVLSTNVKHKNFDSVAGSTKAETMNALAMTPAIQVGLRILSYSEAGPGQFIIGGELNGLFARPSGSSDWRFSQYDSKDKLTAETIQASSSANTPSFNSVRGLFHLGYSVPAAHWIAIDIGAMVGLGMSEAKYVFQSPYTLPLSNGKSDGASGIGVQAGLRVALQFFPQRAVALGLEYRLMADAFGSFFSFMPFIQSNSEVVTTTGHQFLLSAGFRFGREPARPASGG